MKIHTFVSLTNDQFLFQNLYILNKFNYLIEIATRSLFKGEINVIVDDGVYVL